MLELRCPACGLANAVANADVLDRVRCAACEGRLEEDTLVRYFVAEGGYSHGPQVHRDLVNGVAMGTLTPDVLLSEEDGPWFRAGEREDLFGRTRGAVPGAAPRPLARKLRRSAVPGSVNGMALLDVVAGVSILLLAGFGFLFAASWGAVGEALPFFVVLLFLGGGHFALARELRRRSVVARNIQLGLAGLAGVGFLLLLLEGLSAPLMLVLGAVVAVPFFLLLSEEARAWFGGQGEDA